MPSTRASRQFEGLIVSNRPGSGSDSFVDIFSPDYGIVGVVAKGARASKKRFAGGLDIGTFGGLSLKIVGSFYGVSTVCLFSFSPSPCARTSIG